MSHTDSLKQQETPSASWVSVPYKLASAQKLSSVKYDVGFMVVLRFLDVFLMVFQGHAENLKNGFLDGFGCLQS